MQRIFSIISVLYIMLSVPNQSTGQNLIKLDWHFNFTDYANKIKHDITQKINERKPLDLGLIWENRYAEPFCSDGSFFKCDTMYVEYYLLFNTERALLNFYEKRYDDLISDITLKRHFFAEDDYIKDCRKTNLIGTGSCRPDIKLIYKKFFWEELLLEFKKELESSDNLSLHKKDFLLLYLNAIHNSLYPITKKALFPYDDAQSKLKNVKSAYDEEFLTKTNFNEFINEFIDDYIDENFIISDLGFSFFTSPYGQQFHFVDSRNPVGYNSYSFGIGMEVIYKRFINRFSIMTNSIKLKDNIETSFYSFAQDEKVFNINFKYHAGYKFLATKHFSISSLAGINSRTFQFRDDEGELVDTKSQKIVPSLELSFDLYFPIQSRQYYNFKDKLKPHATSSYFFRLNVGYEPLGFFKTYNRREHVVYYQLTAGFFLFPIYEATKKIKRPFNIWNYY